MPKSTELVSSGLHMMQAAAINGTVETGITATAGGTISTSRVLTAGLSVIATAAVGSGVKLPPDMAIGDTIVVKNLGANSVNVFPNRSTEAFNAAGDGAALAVAAAARVEITRISALKYIS